MHVRVCKSVRGYAQVCTSMCKCVLVCVCVHGCVRVCVELIFRIPTGDVLETRFLTTANYDAHPLRFFLKKDCLKVFTNTFVNQSFCIGIMNN